MTPRSLKIVGTSFWKKPIPLDSFIVNVVYGSCDEATGRQTLHGMRAIPGFDVLPARKAGYDGLRSRCILCQAAYGARYYQKNKARLHQQRKIRQMTEKR